jgi:hypothetical protein
MTPTLCNRKKRSHWDVTVGSVWEFENPMTGSIVEARVSGKFDTTEGKYVALRSGDAALGNFPWTALIKKIHGRRG